MPKTPLKIALLTGNNSLGAHYLVRLLRSETASHARLNHLQLDVLKDQIYGAHKDLEQHLNRNIPYFAFPYGGLRDRTFLAEYEAMQVSDQYFACEGGVNQNLFSGAILRIGAHNETESELIKLLLQQYVR